MYCPVLTAHSHKVVVRRPDGTGWTAWYVMENGGPTTWSPYRSIFDSVVDHCLNDVNPAKDGADARVPNP